MSASNIEESLPFAGVQLVQVMPVVSSGVREFADLSHGDDIVECDGRTEATEYQDDVFQDEQFMDKSELEYILRHQHSLRSVRGTNKTFSEDQLRTIERKNEMLVNRIMAHSQRPSQFKTTPAKIVVTSSEINRRRAQSKIAHENLMLLKKIQSVKPFGLSRRNK